MGEAGGVSFAAESAIVICLESFAGGSLSASADEAVLEFQGFKEEDFELRTLRRA